MKVSTILTKLFKSRTVFKYVMVSVSSLFCMGSITAWLAMNERVGAGGLSINPSTSDEEKVINMGIGSGSGDAVDTANLLPGEMKTFMVTISNNDSVPISGEFSIAGANDTANIKKYVNGNVNANDEPVIYDTLKEAFYSDPINQPTDDTLSSGEITAYIDSLWNAFCLGGPYIDTTTLQRYVVPNDVTYETLFTGIANTSDLRDAIGVGVAFYDDAFNGGGYKIYDTVASDYVAFNTTSPTLTESLFSQTLMDVANNEAATTNTTYPFTVPGAVDAEHPGEATIYVVLYYNPHTFVSTNIVASGGNPATTVELQNSNPFYYQSINISFVTELDVTP